MYVGANMLQASLSMWYDSCKSEEERSHSGSCLLTKHSVGTVY